jgi:hypothetical protein
MAFSPPYMLMISRSSILKTGGQQVIYHWIYVLPHSERKLYLLLNYFCPVNYIFNNKLWILLNLLISVIMITFNPAHHIPGWFAGT